MYPKGGLHIYADNQEAMKRNNVDLKDLTGDRYTMKTNDKFLDSWLTLTLTQLDENQKLTKTGGSKMIL